MKPAIRRFSNPEEQARAAARFIAQRAKEYLDRAQRFSLGISGGETPKATYRALAGLPMPWQSTHLFWVDERYVLPQQPFSNHAMARETLLSKISIPEANVHRVPTEIKPASYCAQLYEEELERFFAIPKSQFPAFDLLVLGVGTDGHTASLFPKSEALKEKRLWVTSAQAPEGTPVSWRITLTLPVINQAACVVFLVSGNAKAKVLESLAKGEDRYPAAMVKPRGELLWFVDDAAGQALKGFGDE